jgi:hypothetical protein
MPSHLRVRVGLALGVVGEPPLASGEKVLTREGGPFGGVAPGSMTITWMPSGATSIRMESLSPSTATFVAWYQPAERARESFRRWTR